MAGPLLELSSSLADKELWLSVHLEARDDNAKDEGPEREEAEDPCERVVGKVRIDLVRVGRILGLLDGTGEEGNEDRRLRDLLQRVVLPRVVCEQQDSAL